MKSFCTVLLCLVLASGSWAQSTKRSLTHEDYDGWKSVQRTSLSHDGKWVAYEVNPQEGDGLLVVEAPSISQKIIIPRGYGAKFMVDASYLVAKIKPQREVVRVAKKQKAKPDKMPKDSLVVISLADGKQRFYAYVLSFALPEDAGRWLAVLSKAAEAPKDTTQKASKKKGKQPKGELLSLLNLGGNDSVAFEHVTEYALSKQGNRLVFVQESLRDTSIAISLYGFSSFAKPLEVLDNRADVKILANIALDKQGNQVAWLTSPDSTKAEVKHFALHHRTFGAKNATLISDTRSKQLPDSYTPSEFRKPRFSDDGSRLYFGIAPLALPSRKDTSLLDEEMARLDIWNWQDDRLQPMQDKQKKQDLENGFLAMYDLTGKKLVPLATSVVDDVEFSEKVNHGFLLGRANAPYQRMSSWDPGHADYYLIDTQTGVKSMIGKDVMGRAELSPAGKYAFWFDQRDTLWKVYDVNTNNLLAVTKNLPIAFQDEDHDTPDLPGAYGFAGWTANDRYFLVYDRYDIWQIDPTQKEKPVNLTKGYGRKEKVALRYLATTEDEQFVDITRNNMLAGSWEGNKDTGLLTWKAGEEPAVVYREAYNYLPSSVMKAKNANVYVFQKGNYTHANELYYVTDWKNPQRLTNLTNQLNGIKWGSAELVSWLSNQGTKIEGLLFKPEGFDPAKKYPMLVYYYERNASTLNAFRTPAPSRSTINIPYSVSNDYLVFVPDIVYGGGTPGKNAYDCIVSGVLDLIKKGFVDKDRIGIQGQSWGGYQTAYLITQTNMFRAAGAGAIVANMTSAYGGIRWGTGMSRMFQYEKTQSRVGGTLWEKPMYYLENSPLFYADRVQTPVLMMHNDADGSVPWYQGIEFFTALRRLNKPVWMLVYNDEDHNLTRRPNMKDLSIRMYQFFDHYLKDAPMPSWMSGGRTAIEKERWDMKYE